MAKRSSIIEMTSYGIYSTWDSKSKQLPKIQEFTVRVPAEVDIEFGFIINIKKAKGQKKFNTVFITPPVLRQKMATSLNHLMGGKSISIVMTGISI